MATPVFDVPMSVRRRMQAEAQQQTITQPVPDIRESVAVRVHEKRDYVATESASWTWSQLRDYVITQIEARAGGPVPRLDAYKERSIFQGFLSRHERMAGPIAEHAFDVYDGMWMNAPISVRRFCANCDPYFADVIKARLQDRAT